MPTRVQAELVDVAAEDGHALDVRLFKGLAAVWQLTGAEQASVLALTPALHERWVSGDIDPDFATAVGTRLGHLLSIDLAAQACYGPGTALAAEAVRRQGTAPDGVGAAFPLLSRDLSALVAVRHAFEQRAGGAHILTVAPFLAPRDHA